MDTKKLHKRIANDCDFPLPVPAHFNYYYQLYGSMFNMAEFMYLAGEACDKLDGADGFFGEFNRLKEVLVNHVKNKPEYTEFNSCDIGAIYPMKSNFQNRKLYSPENHGKHFVSFDMVQANFQALRYHNVALVDSHTNYFNFIGQFTDLDYFRKTKRIRQVLFGNTNPKRLQRIQSHVTACFVQRLQEEVFKCDPDLSRFVSATNDEVVIEIMEGETETYMSELQKLADSDKGKFKLTFFRLDQLKPYSMYAKVPLDTGNVEFKCVPSYLFPQVYKHWHKLDLDDRDLRFIFEHNEAQFVKPLEFE